MLKEKKAEKEKTESRRRNGRERIFPLQRREKKNGLAKFVLTLQNFIPMVAKGSENLT